MRVQGLTRLVERNMPVLADSTQEELNPAHRADQGLVVRTLAVQVIRVSIEDVHLRRRDVDCKKSS